MSNLLAAGVLATAGFLWWISQGRARGGAPSFDTLVTFIVCIISYTAIYLGCTNLLLRLLRRVADVTVVTSLLMNMLVLLAGWGIPWVIHEMSDFRGSDYSLLHITDPFWSTVAVVEPRMGGGYTGTIVWIVAPVAVAVFLLNLVYIAPELQQVRVALPKRIEDEERELHPAPLPQPTNPWDDVGPQ